MKTFEALLRWRHPERGLFTPDCFIPLAEEIGLIVPLGDWVLREPAPTRRAGPRRSASPSISRPRSSSRAQLVTQIASALRDSGLTPRRLEVEITENVLLKDKEATLAICTG